MPVEFGDVCVLGLGYIGLPTAAIIASRGLRVVGVDVDERIIRTVNNGEVHIVEPDLHHLVRGVVNSQHLQATNTPKPADVFVVSVPTPTNDDHTADLSYVYSAVRSIAPVLDKGNLVIIESTCPVGTTEAVSELLRTLRADLVFPTVGHQATDIHLAYCPERVLPGKILTELVFNDRSIGGLTPRCSELAASFYGKFVRGRCIKTDARTAELVKLSENAFRDVNIALANELSAVCERLGVDVWRLIELANLHPRVNILQPGPGVGGHCIAVDPWFIIQTAPDETPLLQAARSVNDGRPAKVFEKVEAFIQSSGEKRIACLGLAYKADVDDMRESPSIEIASRLAERFPGKITAVEPNIRMLPKRLLDLGVTFSPLSEALERCDVILLLVGHREFREIEPRLLSGKKVFDQVGLWRAERAV